MTARIIHAFCIAAVLAVAGLAHSQNIALPGKGVHVLPVQNTIAEESFQTLLVVRALQALGYTVETVKEIEPAAQHLAIANGDATFMADHWLPLQKDLYANAGGDAKMQRKGVYSLGALQGYLIDKKTADAHGITHIDQLKDPKIAQLFDSDGNGKADLAGCNPGWSCGTVVEYHIQAYGLENTVEQRQGAYTALIADTINRFRLGEPVLYYTWTPYWVSSVLQPGRDVVWLEVPFSSMPGSQKDVDTRLPNGKNYGFTSNNQHIVVNRAFAQANPAAAKLFEIMQLPAADINAQNLRMRDGESSPRDIERHVEAWIKANQKTFDGWIEQALAAVK